MQTAAAAAAVLCATVPYHFLTQNCFSIRMSTIVGSSSVLVSPKASGSPSASLRRIRLIILPAIVAKDVMK
jgi:hypothetical protein